MFGSGFIILFACASLIAFVTTKDQTTKSNKEDTTPSQIEESRE